MTNKKNDIVVAGVDCEGCKYSENKDKNRIICNARNKTYFYGQYVRCNDREEGNKK